MAVIPASRGNPQTTEIVQQEIETFIGNSAREDLGTVISTVNDDLQRTHEDKNIMLSGGGTILFSGTTVSFTEDLYLEINQNTTTTPIRINLGSTSLNFSVDLRMWIVSINRSLGTVASSVLSTANPSILGNKDTFILAKRIDSVENGSRVYFYNGMVLNEGDEALLGAAGGGGGGYAKIFLSM